MKASYKQQTEVIEQMQSAGFNVSTCGNCGDVILYNKEMKEADTVACPHCKREMAYSDNPDLYYQGCWEVKQEQEMLNAKNKQPCKQN